MDELEASHHGLREANDAAEPPALPGEVARSSTVLNYTLRFTGAPGISPLVAVAVASAV